MSSARRVQITHVMQAGCPSRYARMDLVVVPGRTGLFGPLIDQDGQRVEWLRSAIQVPEGIGVRVLSCVVHPVDSQPRDFAYAVKCAVQAAVDGLESARWARWTVEPWDPAVAFVSGHLDLTPAEFEQHYAPALTELLRAGASFVVGDARGADALAQAWLAEQSADVTVFHMFDSPRHHSEPHVLRGGFTSDAERDRVMTDASTCDVAWVRPGRERSGTAKNLARRSQR